MWTPSACRPTRVVDDKRSRPYLLLAPAPDGAFGSSGRRPPAAGPGRTAGQTQAAAVGGQPLPAPPHGAAKVLGHERVEERIDARVDVRQQVDGHARRIQHLRRADATTSIDMKRERWMDRPLPFPYSVKQ